MIETIKKVGTVLWAFNMAVETWMILKEFMAEGIEEEEEAEKKPRRRVRR